MGLRPRYREPVSAIILAGGRSSRMGTSKALLRFDDEPLILHVVRKLTPLFSDIVVVAAPGERLPELPAKVVHDEVAYQGPVGGISRGLGAVEGEAAFVTSCDAAFLDVALIRHLLSTSEGEAVVVPRWGGRLQPLHAVYSTRLLPVFQSEVAAGQLRLLDVLSSMQVRVVEEAEIRQFDPHGWSFFNMNTPDDYACALEHWRAR